MRFKEIIRKKAIGKHPLSDYIAVGVPTFSENKESTYWCFNETRIKVIANCVLYDPAIVGVYFSNEKPKSLINNKDSYFLEYYNDTNDSIGMMTLQFEDTIMINDTEKIYLFIVKNADLKLTTFRLKTISQYIYWKLKRKHKSFLSTFNSKYYRILSTLFAQPRFVRLLTISIDENNTKHFPIDLYTHINNKIVFGLRNSNNNSKYLTKGVELCISDVLMEHKAIVYGLGKFGGKSNNSINYVASEQLKIQIPDLFFSYVEIKLIDIIRYENQTIYQATVLNHFIKIERKKDFILSHIQLLRYLQHPLSYPHK